MAMAKSMGIYPLVLVSLLVICVQPSSSAAATNPYQQGCLYAKNLTQQIRVCGSEDPLPEAVEKGWCRMPPIDYAEVRLLPGDWEATFYETWILQIALQEMLYVPASVELGSPELSLNLYDPDKRTDTHADYVGYKNALELVYLLGGDCSKADRSQGEGYQQCGHFMPESWNVYVEVQDMVYRGVLEPPQSLGMLAQESWFVPKFTAQKDPTVLNYIGLQGEDKREKLAQQFLRPTTWMDYCQQVSRDNCTTPDDVAQRAPSTQEETTRMFVDGLYTGHFRATERNNCTNNNDNPQTYKCTGHIADFPCHWRSPVPGQLHYLEIPLDTDMDQLEYSYSQLTEIWRAANATKSDVIMMWWAPEQLVGEFLGTDAEFTQIGFPHPTLECLEGRSLHGDHCSPDDNLRYGSPASTCGEPAKGLNSLMSTTLFHNAHGGSLTTVGGGGSSSAVDNNDKVKYIPEAIHSPSHAALENFQFSELQLEEIFRLTNQLGDPRDAVCEWVASNMEYMQARFIPRTYPRVPVAKAEDGPLMYAATIVGGIVLGLVLVTVVVVEMNRHKDTIKWAQIEFLNLLLGGSFLIALGAILIGAPSTDASCTAEVWLINLGYLFELCPLIVKVTAVNHIMNIGQQMRRTRVRRDVLYGVVFLVGVLVVIFLTCWTVLDPPRVIPEYRLTDEVDQDGNTIVWVLDVCGSNSPVWSFVFLGWNCLLLLCTTILAIQMRKVAIQEFCESSTLALLVYSHFVFILLRVVVYTLRSSVSGYILHKCESLIFSADTAATLVIYFFPKIFAIEKKKPPGLALRDGGRFALQSARNFTSKVWSFGKGHSSRSQGNDKDPKQQPTRIETITEQGQALGGDDVHLNGTKDDDNLQNETVVGKAVLDEEVATSPPRDKPSGYLDEKRNRVKRYSSAVYSNIKQSSRLSNWIVVSEGDLGYDDTSGRPSPQSDEESEVDDGLLSATDENEEEGTIPLLRQRISLLQRNNTALAEETDRQRDEIADLKRKLEACMDYSSSRR